MLHTNLQAQLLSDKLYQEWHRTNQRMQADVSARLTALHNHINSVSSTHKLAGDSAKEDCESATSPSHVTRTKNDEQGEGKKLVCYFYCVPIQTFSAYSS